MVISMFLAHILGDYVFQWDGLARWKSKSPRGVLAHGLIVLGVTWLLSLPFDPNWWPYVLVIGLSHLAIDMGRARLVGPVRPLAGLGLFLLDQATHLLIIVVALVHSGYLTLEPLLVVTSQSARDVRLWVFVLGYLLITMPAWVTIRFVVQGLVVGSGTETVLWGNKYVGILERSLITTFVVLGQFALVPLVAVPRLIFEGQQVRQNEGAAGYVAELLISVGLAVAVGLVLRQVR
jgi:hypothetical protein